MTATLTLPPAAAQDRDEAAELLAMPAWLYRSEAFAEDLPAAEPLWRGPAPMGRPRAAQRAAGLRSGALYLATLALALAASVPSALLLA
ncbi:hypothetical protein [Aquabacterium sp.]|uniref:hypothetical protein n=1 Tax=Aquabacterium sp. TaxID=1872578 RepID=UPI003784CF5E